jgi:hypothetical protein
VRCTALAGLAVVLVLAACGASKPAKQAASATTTSKAASPTHPLSVTPPAPTPASRVTFAFTAPATAGHHGASELSFVLVLAGPRKAGCVGPRTAPLAHAIKGQTASVVLGGTWCSGAYVARVQEFARPFCKPGQMCPQYVRLIGTVATARFRVAA